jgi:hypothetical protein
LDNLQVVVLGRDEERSATLVRRLVHVST